MYNVDIYENRQRLMYILKCFCVLLMMYGLFLNWDLKLFNLYVLEIRAEKNPNAGRNFVKKTNFSVMQSHINGVRIPKLKKQFRTELQKYYSESYFFSCSLMTNVCV